jgi:hypothetical protein
MQRFSALARWISVALAVVLFIVKEVVLPVVVDFIKQQPETNDFLHVVLKFLLDLAQQTWLPLAAWIFVGFVAGLWVAWLLQKLDGSRADKRKALGAEMAKLGNYLGQIKFPFPTKENARIMSCFASAKKFGIWAPDDRAFPFQAARARSLITDYLSKVGQMLSDGNFREAKQYAKKSKADFDSIA